MANFSANLNKENLITVTVNKATVGVDGSMNFYITDKRTCNIYCQLKYDASTNSLIKNQQEVDNAEDFVITMRIIKPNNEPKELEFEFLDQPAMFYVSLTDEYKDYVGTYKCELFVDCYVNGILERITTSSFSYKVNASIMNNLDDVIEKDPDYPLVDEILEKLDTVNLDNYATKEYVEEAIADIDIPEIDLTAYATNESVDKKIAAIEIPDVSGYATTEYVDNIIHVIDKGSADNEITFDDFLKGQHTYKLNGTIFGNDNHWMKFMNELVFVSKADHPAIKKLTIYRSRNTVFGTGLGGVGSDYTEIDYKNNTCKHDYNATQSYVDKKIAAIDTSDIDLSDYATKVYVDDAIAGIEVSGGSGCDCDLTGYATIDYVDDAIANIEIPEVEIPDLTNYATKSYVNNYVDNAGYATKADLDKAIIVIDNITAGFDDFPDGSSVCKLTGSVFIQDINGNALSNVGEMYKQLVYVYKYNSETVKSIYFYTIDNKYVNFDIMKGKVTRSTYNVTQEYLSNYVANETNKYATKAELNAALGNIESLLKEI